MRQQVRLRLVTWRGDIADGRHAAAVAADGRAPESTGGNMLRTVGQQVAAKDGIHAVELRVVRQHRVIVKMVDVGPQLGRIGHARHFLDIEHIDDVGQDQRIVKLPADLVEPRHATRIRAPFLVAQGNVHVGNDIVQQAHAADAAHHRFPRAVIQHAIALVELGMAEHGHAQVFLPFRIELAKQPRLELRAGTGDLRVDARIGEVHIALDHAQRGIVLLGDQHARFIEKQIHPADMPALFAVTILALEIIGHFRLHQENRRRIMRDRIDIHIQAAVFAHDEDAEIIGQSGEVALGM
ncbi:hypothetical protein D3C85_860990 [compost metagenome]